jgi:hypothetical protein
MWRIVAVIALLLSACDGALQAADATISRAFIDCGQVISTRDPVTVSITLGPVQTQFGAGLLDTWLNQVLPLMEPGTRRTTVRYEIELYKVWWWVFDSKLGSWKIENWVEGKGAWEGGGYTVFKGEDGSAHDVSSWDEIRTLLRSVNSAKLITLLEGTGKYYVKVRAVRDTSPFAPGVGFTTEWYTSPTIEIKVLKPPQPEVKISNIPGEIHLGDFVNARFDAFNLTGTEGDAELVVRFSSGIKYDSTNIAFNGGSEIHTQFHSKGSLAVDQSGKTHTTSNAFVQISISPMKGQATAYVAFTPRSTGLHWIDYRLTIKALGKGNTLVNFPSNGEIDEQGLQVQRFSFVVNRLQSKGDQGGSYTSERKSSSTVVEKQQGVENRSVSPAGVVQTGNCGTMPAGWKTYYSKRLKLQFGYPSTFTVDASYEFKYPDQAFIHVYRSRDYALLKVPTSQGGYYETEGPPVISISSYSNPRGLNARAWLDSTPGYKPSSRARFETMNVAGFNAIVFSDEGMTYSDNVVFGRPTNKDVIYASVQYFNKSDDIRNVLRQIVSTVCPVK